MTLPEFCGLILNWRQSTYCKTCQENAKTCTRQYVTPVVFVVTDARQANPDGEIHGKGLQEVSKKLAARPRETSLEIQLYLHNISPWLACSIWKVDGV